MFIQSFTSRSNPILVCSFSGDVSICADVYKTYRSAVQHVTPFTTWVFTLSSRSLDLDFSQLTDISIRFLGSGMNMEAGPHALQSSSNSCS
jgi:hypothetical protein